jgi:hypothetical protein
MRRQLQATCTLGLTYVLLKYITLNDWNRSQSWAEHISGAIALLQLRGRQQFTSERGRQLFLLLVNQVVCQSAGTSTTLHTDTICT